MLLRLAYLGVANVFALLQLLPVSNEDKDAEILALRPSLSAPKRRPSAADAESSDPPSSGFVVERRDRGDATKGAIIHTTDCSWSPHNARPVEVRLARDALAKDARFFEACSFCRPDNALGFLE